MTLKTALLITGDSAAAVRAVDDLARAVEKTGVAGKAAATGLAEHAAAERATATAAGGLATIQQEAAREFQSMSAAATTASGALGGVAGAAGTAAGAIGGASGKVKEHARAVNDNDMAAVRHAMGLRNLGQQFGDLAVMIQGGIDPARAFATQAGQMGYALSEMGGKAGAVGAFLTGPWGIALTIGVAALAPFVQQLLAGSDAADKQREALAQAASAADSYGNAQSLLGKVIDLTTGRLKTQNQVLVQTIKLQAQANILAAQADQKEATKQLAGMAQPTTVEGVSAGLRGTVRALFDPGYRAGGEAAALKGRLAPLQDALSAYSRLANSAGVSEAALGEGLDRTLTRIDQLAKAGQLAGRDAIEAKKAVLALGTALNDQRANRAAVDVLNGGALPDELKPYERPKKPPKPKSTDARDEFGRDTADRIASITSQFDSTPPLVRQIEQAGRQLTDVIDDLRRRKPPGFEQLIRDAEAARTAIQGGINRPLDDLVDQQAEQLRQGELVVQGRLLEAEAARSIVAIERQRGPLSAEQKAQVLASVVALQAQERQLERVRAAQQVNLGALQDMQAIVRQTIYEGPQSLADLPGRVFDSFKRFSAEKIAEEWFGEMFRDARDKITGANKVDQSANVLVSAFDRVGASADMLSARLATPAGNIPPAGAVATAGVGVSEQSIEVVARRRSEIYGDTIAGVLKKVGIGKDTAADIGRGAGKALAGAFEGQAAAGVAGMLGVKTSGTGAALGGAIGSFLPIPGGSIIGGLAGGVLGGLFGQKKDYGTATLTGSGDAAIGGNAGSAKSGAGGLADQVRNGLAQIAEQLGGQLGSYLVSIGTYDGDYRVSTSGQTGELSFGKKNKSKSTLVDFGEDQGAAIAYAIGDAIKDGAVTGLSAAVAKAIQSSADVDKALAEALKVSELETLLGGFSATAERAFRDLEATAKDRVRIARDYGFDVVAIEKRNAEDRLKLAEDLTRAQVGSLQSLVQEMTAGSLFEGSALDRIGALNTAIDKAKADLDAGVEGAADTLASLYQQRLTASKDAYGTTGAYAADRAATIAEAQAAIARVNAQIVAAQKTTSDPALATTNAALDENNDQNARMLAVLERNNALMEQLVGRGASGTYFDLERMAAI